MADSINLKLVEKGEEMGSQIHVTKTEDGTWKVKQPDNQRASAICKTQSEATKVATSIAKNQGLEVVIHGMDGKIREKNSFGNDPYPPRG